MKQGIPNFLGIVEDIMVTVLLQPDYSVPVYICRFVQWNLWKRKSTKYILALP